MSGKGDTPRPPSVPQETFAERWARTFGQRSQEATHAANEAGNHAAAWEAYGLDGVAALHALERWSGVDPRKLGLILTDDGPILFGPTEE